jgi:aryl-alcohol dehydrogenase-like predicted oxidoreductase
MEYRTFGRTGWKVSEIGLGGSWFYGRPEMGLKPPSHGVGVVERALELGVNYFDTAPLYGKGRSEEVLGEALRGVTEPYYLATKVGYYPEPFNYTRDDVWRGIDGSLKRLKRDHVNLLQLHESEMAGWDGIFGKGRALEAMVEAKEQGVTDEIGLTGSDLDLMSKVLEDTDEFVSVITFLKYDLLTQEARNRLVPTAVDHEVAVICASPLHGGLLGSTRDHWVENERFSDLYSKLREIESLVAHVDEPIERTGLRYLLSDPNVSLILSGVQDIGELEASCSVSDGQFLPEELIEEIEGVTG